MQLVDGVSLVGSGGARLSNRYDCNVYLVRAPDGPVLVDAGGGLETGRLFENAREALGDPVAVLLTHAHSDHSQGGPDFQEEGVPVVASESTARLTSEGTDHELGLDVARRDDVYPADYSFEHYEVDRTFRAGETITVGGREFESVRTRGHAGDHTSYVTDVGGRRCCFVGDAVFPDGVISLLNTPDSSLAGYREDIEHLEGRGIDALCPGHELPRLEDGQESVDRAAEALRGMYSPPSRT
jgi:glyoxylase-like metal-dependent hydrolase (beta-lactamase superfamily II)